MTLIESPSVAVSRRGSAAGDPESTVVWLRGDHDIATKAFLAITFDRAAQLDDCDLLLDLSEVTFMDASTIGAIVASSNSLRSRSRSLEIRAPSRRAHFVLRLCGIATGAPAPSGPVHPTGLAAALGTWVDVPSTHPGELEDLPPLDVVGVRRPVDLLVHQPTPLAAEVERRGQ